MSRGTQIRHVRITDEIWMAALAKASRTGQSVSGIIREALVAWLAAEED